MKASPITELRRKQAVRTAAAKRSPGNGIQSQVLGFKKGVILSVAARLFFRHGYTATTLDDIAAELGVTKPFIYSHFESKQDILTQLFYRTMDESLAAFQDFDPEGQPAAEGLRELAVRFVRVVIAARDGVGFFWRGDKDVPPLDIRRARAFKSAFEKPFLAVIGRGVDSREFRPVDGPVVMRCIEGMIHWIYVWYQTDGRLSAEEIANEIAALVVNMVVNRPGFRRG